VLFGEDASRVVLSSDPGNISRIKQVAEKHGVWLDVIGETIPENIEMGLDGRTVVSAQVYELREIYEGALEKALQAEAVAGD
jgi:phosphoribosylformylglycinamidine synthase subunit PurL